MTGTEEDGPSVRPAATKPSVDPILDGKLHRPPTRADWVERDRLLELLDQAVAATRRPGCRTGGVREDHDGRRSGWPATAAPAVAAWVSLDSRDNDPVRLWTHVAMALERAGCPRTGRCRVHGS